MPMTKEEIEQKRAEAMAAGAAGGGRPATAAPPRPGGAGAPNQSRLTLARAAIRPEMKGRVMLSGPAGAGKTYTALVIATALVGPHGRILVIDTEKESSLTYADVFTFEQLPWNPPFDPTALSLTLKEAASSYDCCIVDSFSHYWRKQGGVLDIAGDNVRGWKSARPIQENLIETLLDVDMHVIVCCRSKMDHLLEDKGGGKISVTKVGLKAQQDDDLEYEVNVAISVDMQHVIHVEKSRTNAVPVGAMFLAGLGGDFAQQYRDWLRSGEPVAEKAATDLLGKGLDQIEDLADRARAKYAFLDTFGRPEFLLVSRLTEAQQWVVDVVNGTLPIDRAEDAVPPEPGGVEGAGGTTPAVQPGQGAPQASDRTDTPPAAAQAASGDSGASDGVPPTPDGCTCDVERVGEGDGPEAFEQVRDRACPVHGEPLTDRPGSAAAEDAESMHRSAAGSDSDDREAIGSAAVASITAQVTTMKHAAVVDELTKAHRSTNGTPRQVRDRLVELRIERAAREQVSTDA